MVKFNLSEELRGKVKVLGIGGCGNHIISRISKDIDISVIDFIAIDTDKKTLDSTNIESKIFIDSISEVEAKMEKVIDGVGLLFIVASAGGQAGANISWEISKLAKERGIVTIGLFTKPFSFEGMTRMKNADMNLAALKSNIDTLIAVQNDKIFEVVDMSTPMIEAFGVIDNLFLQAINSVSSSINMPTVVNLDFENLVNVFKNKGLAQIGIGISKDDKSEAVKDLLESVFFDIDALKRASDVLLLSVGGKDLTLIDINSSIGTISEYCNEDSNMMFASEIVDEYEGRLMLIALAMGI